MDTLRKCAVKKAQVVLQDRHLKEVRDKTHTPGQVCCSQWFVRFLEGFQFAATRFLGYGNPAASRRFSVPDFETLFSSPELRSAQ